MDVSRLSNVFFVYSPLCKFRAFIGKLVKRVPDPSPTVQIRAFVKLMRSRAEVSDLKFQHYSITPVMICRLVLSLKKATDPNVVRAWDVDHFTQFEPQAHHGSTGMPLTPMIFRPPTVASLERGMKWEENRLAIPAVVNRPPPDGWTIDGPEGHEENNYRKGNRV